MKINFSVSRVGRRRGGHRQAHVHLHGHFKYPNVGHQSDATRVLLTLRVRLSTHWLCTNTSFIGWMALVCFITFFIQKKASLVEAIHFELSGMLSSWLRENIKCNIFLRSCNFEKIVRIMPQVTAMLPHYSKLTLISIQRDQMPLSKIFSASTSNAIFWTKKVIKHTSAIQPHKETVNYASLILMRFHFLTSGLPWDVCNTTRPPPGASPPSTLTILTPPTWPISSTPTASGMTRLLCLFKLYSAILL